MKKITLALLILGTSLGSIAQEKGKEIKRENKDNTLRV